MEIRKSSDGRTNLHIYREGDEYFRQKSPVFLKEFTTVIFNLEPQPPDSPLIYWNLTRALPFPDNAFDAVDCYHVYEHLLHKEADFFTREVYRVLKPGGIYRASVPNLEFIAGEYLKYLEAAIHEPNEQNLKRYRWTVMKLIEQCLREKSGGIMLDAIQNGEFDRAYVKKHYGEAFDIYFEEPSKWPRQTEAAPPPKSFVQRLSSITPEKIRKKIRWLKYERDFKKYRTGEGKDMRYNRETVTLLPDRLYLRLKFEKQGFKNFTIKDYKTSDIPNWEKYDLDRSNSGDYPFDPSLYVEVKKACLPAGREG